MDDRYFIRGKIPMTKSEVRAVSLSKLELEKDSVVYDIGAGTGSVAIEAALYARQGHVYAIEQKREGCELIRRNQEKFGVGNLTVLEGRAPKALRELPAPDRVFVGGSGGELGGILDLVWEKNPRARAVVNVLALETLAAVWEYLEHRRLEAEIVSIQVSRAKKTGNYHLMQGQNPVYIITVDPAAGWGGEELTLNREVRQCCI
ncbi:MAG: precorrin-6Y C5,15-methyltransferase (decarboxylating) subunit CbiT [Lachnospiraceae bacterium]|nr:precorrin-6Y C5,15-methyltransferase (decarboxylating) subunit CbiT [Lachnospiraceae bacterium]